MIVRCSGIAFAVALMFLEIGFRNALFDSNVRIIDEKITADLVIRSASRYMLSSRQLLSLDAIRAARSCVGVGSIEPMYLESRASEIRCAGCLSRRVRVLAFDPDKHVFANFGLASIADRLADIGTAAADIKSKTFFGFPKRLQNRPSATEYELAGKKLHLVGLFASGIDFSNDGNLIMTPHNFAHFFPLRADGNPLSQVDYGFVCCDTAVDQGLVIARLQQLLGPSVIVQTRRAFLESEREFWRNSTPIGLVFWVGTIIGFVVGMSICYQVLATDIADHLSEFSTLKAMGHSTGYFVSVVVAQALILSVISFIPGVLVALASFRVTNIGTGLDLFLNFERTAFVGGLTILMCVFSGILALRKLLIADPASLY